jgi:hypothetical protein
VLLKDNIYPIHSKVAQKTVLLKENIYPIHSKVAQKTGLLKSMGPVHIRYFSQQQLKSHLKTCSFWGVAKTGTAPRGGELCTFSKHTQHK